MSPDHIGPAGLPGIIDEVHRVVLDAGGVDIHEELTRLAPLLTSAQPR